MADDILKFRAGDLKDLVMERAAEAIAEAWHKSARPTAHAIAAITAAMPHIREALAQEIEADRDEVAKGTGSTSVVRTGGRLWGINRAARIVRGKND